MNQDVAIMPNILLMHGINLNALGKRDPALYGMLTLQDIEEITVNEAKNFGYEMMCYQSNHEGNLVDKLQSVASLCVGIIINPGAFSHYSYGLHDALLDTGLPVIEVHLSYISERESWRKHSVTAAACIKLIKGKKEQGYKEAVHTLVEYLRK
jgi:3-dehydroquinate dehydratase-2